MRHMLFLACLSAAGCTTIHRSEQGIVTYDGSMGPRGATAMLQATADYDAVNDALALCQAALTHGIPCATYDPRTGSPILVVGNQWYPYAHGLPMGSSIGWTEADVAAMAVERHLQARSTSELR